MKTTKRPETQLQFWDEPSTIPKEVHRTPQNTWIQKRTAWLGAVQQGWQVVSDRTVSWNVFEYWGSVLVWPEPIHEAHQTTWAVVNVSRVTTDTDRTLPARFGLAQAETIEALRQRGEATDVWQGVEDWSFETHHIPLDAVSTLAQQFSQVLGRATARFPGGLLSSPIHAAIQEHLPTDSYGSILTIYCFADRWPNAYIRSLQAVEAQAFLPESIMTAIVAEANNPWHRQRLIEQARDRLYTLGLARAAPAPWHWPPWAANGMRMLGPYDSKLVVDSAIQRQWAFEFDKSRR